MKNLFSKNAANRSTYLCVGLLLLISNPAFALYESSILHYDTGGRLVYHSDEEGNRIVDFSHVGYHSGESDLPVLPVVRTIGPVAGDNTAHIQAGIDYIAANFSLDANGRRGALLLLPGTYEVSGIVYIDANGIVLRGSGQGSDPATNTVIKGTGTSQMKEEGIIIIELSTGGATKISGTQQDVTSEYIPARRSQGL